MPTHAFGKEPQAAKWIQGCPPSPMLILAREGRLDPATLRRVREHLTGCDDCFRAVQVLCPAADPEGKE